jgi:uncharacterized protein
VRAVASDQASALAPPATAGERISAIDVLRGVAVLGILVINVEYFGLLHSNKSAAGTEWVGVYFPAGMGPRALAGWIAIRTLFEGKMRAVFSMLFGATAVLLTSRLERRDDGARTADVYYRRTLWLLVFGVAHAYLLWEGDILFGYAVCGLFLFPFRRLPARRLALLGALVLSMSLPRAAAMALHRRDLRAQAAQANADAAGGKKLSKAQETAQSDWEEITDTFTPDADALDQERRYYHGGYAQLFWRRAELVRYVESSDFYGWAFFDGVGMMLIGMALVKAGVITGQRSRAFYAWMLAAGYGVGVPASVAYARGLQRHHFDPIAVAWLTAVYEPGRIAVALGHVALVMWIVKSNRLPGLTGALGDVGRMALSNYLAATLICTTLFDGHGLGLFGSLPRRQLYLLVVAIWLLQALASRWWLRAFRFGPAEWLWRSLTYWQRQPMRLAATATAASAVKAPP